MPAGSIPCGHTGAFTPGCHHCRLAATRPSYARHWGVTWEAPAGAERLRPELPPPPQPVPPAEWPKWANWVAGYRHPEDLGVGDTVARNLGTAGEWFKAAFKAVMGFSCGCEQRQAEWNASYPYPPG